MKKFDPYKNTTMGISLGLCLGVGLGIVFDDLAMGIGIGMCLGIAVGSALDNRISKQNKQEIAHHYDSLVDENNDPVLDDDALKEHMNTWDGDAFINELELDSNKSVLEIGVGTGRLAVRVCGNCKHFTGIDLSQKSIDRASLHLKDYDNKTLICDDFLTHKFYEQFDVVYSSLTFMHIADKLTAIYRVKKILQPNGIFVLSITKSTDTTLECNGRKLTLYPADHDEIVKAFASAKLKIQNTIETKNAYVFKASPMGIISP